MRAVRPIIHCILVLAIISAGLPLYQTGDMNRDGKMGLEDAILSVRHLAKAASDEVSFRQTMENALTSLAVAAGLTSVLRSAREPGIDRSLPAAPLFIVTSSYTLESYPSSAPCIAGPSFCYHSPLLMPPTPPPRISQS